MQQVINNGEYNYWSPRTREGHSDRCTALALAVRAAENPGRSSASAPFLIRESVRAAVWAGKSAVWWVVEKAAQTPAPPAWRF